MFCRQAVFRYALKCRRDIPSCESLIVCCAIPGCNGFFSLFISFPAYLFLLLAIIGEIGPSHLLLRFFFLLFWFFNAIWIYSLLIPILLQSRRWRIASERMRKKARRKRRRLILAFPLVPLTGALNGIVAGVAIVLPNIDEAVLLVPLFCFLFVWLTWWLSLRWMQMAVGTFRRNRPFPDKSAGCAPA